MPLGLAAISTVTATTSATATPSLSATNRRGTIGRQHDLPTHARAPRARARGSLRAGAARSCCTADCTSISIGQKVAKATMASSMRTPKPKISIASGISATEGTGRSTSIDSRPNCAARARQARARCPARCRARRRSASRARAVPSVKPVASPAASRRAAAPAKALSAALGGASAVAALCGGTARVPLEEARTSSVGKHPAAAQQTEDRAALRRHGPPAR